MGKVLIAFKGGENNKQRIVHSNGYVIIRNISQLKNFERNMEFSEKAGEMRVES